MDSHQHAPDNLLNWSSAMPARPKNLSTESLWKERRKSLSAVGRPRKLRKTEETDKLLRSTRSVATMLILPFIAILLLLLGTNEVASLRTPPGFYYPDPRTPDNATIIKVGIYLLNVYEVQPGSNSFWGTMYLWFKFSANETRWIESKGTFNPLDGFEANNAVQTVDLFLKRVIDKPEYVPESNEYVTQVYVQGRFYQPIDLKNYPLDKQTLSINIENTAETREEVAYVPDDSQINFDSLLKLPGWTISNLSTETLIHDYNTNFGITGQDNQELYSTVHFVLTIQRSSNLFGWKLLLPLLLVLVSSWLALILHPSYVEVRTGMCATALLTTVFLQQSSIDASLVSGLVIMDQLYVLSYVLIVITFTLVIIDNNRIRRFTAEEKDVQTEESQLLAMGAAKEGDVEARKDMIEDRNRREAALVKSIRMWDYSCLAVQVVVAIVVIVTITVVEPNQ